VVKTTVRSTYPALKGEAFLAHSISCKFFRADKFIEFDGVVLQADINAAVNVLARMSDAEIALFTRHTMAKEILFNFF
jgi:hypothetical protein